MAHASPSFAPTRRIVITGGPGAGKTALLELARVDLCRHVDVLPESARIVLGGGFRVATTTSAPEARSGPSSTCSASWNEWARPYRT